MRTLTLFVVATLATAVPAVAASDLAAAKPAKPKADLVTKAVSASLAAGKVSVLATVKNKGTKKAPSTEARFYLSANGSLDSSDTVLGTASVAKIRPKKAKPAIGTFTVPSVAAGSYHVVICADSAGAVKERKETNNCSASSGTVSITGTGGGPSTGPVTVSATAGTGGTVAASGVTGGSCAATTCTLTTPGTGTVTFTPTPGAGYRFGAWTGATCTGYSAGAGNAITFADPTSDKACTATFVKQVTITFAGPPLGAGGSVAGSASNGSCTTADVLTGTGTCTVDAGVGTVTLTATPVILFKLGSWSAIAPAVCDGTPSGNTMAFTAPATDGYLGETLRARLLRVGTVDQLIAVLARSGTP